MNELSPETVELIRILAAVDSMFGTWPDPREDNLACFAIDERQRAYRGGRGLRRVVAGGTSDRKSGQRLLAGLVDDGLIRSQKAAGAHRHVSLTDKGDDRARGLLGFYRCCDCWNVFRGVAEAVKAGPGKWAAAKQIAEGLGETDDRIAWAMILPLLARGFIEAAVDTRAQTIFTIRPAKSELAVGDPPEVLADVKPDERLNPIFWASFDAAEADKATWRPSRPNCVYCSVLN